MLKLLEIVPFNFSKDDLIDYDKKKIKNIIIVHFINLYLL